jgi:HAD superfamily hydrolase (TIGR01509 family)
LRNACVLFDMDGTLCTSELDFLELREQLGLPRDGQPILAQLRAAPPRARTRGIRLLQEMEARGAEASQLLPGAAELVTWLRRQGVACALITNNSRRSVDVVLGKFPLSFDLILTRDDGLMKPDPQLFLKALHRLGTAAEDAVAVGDTHLDALAAHRAGITQIHLVNLPEWMAELVSEEVAYEPAVNLFEVRARLGEWMTRRGAADG